VAQLGARFHGMEEVVGSIPTRSTNQSNNLADRAAETRCAGSLAALSAALPVTTPQAVEKKIDSASRLADALYASSPVRMI
jgi:hypothetical protein